MKTHSYISCAPAVGFEESSMPKESSLNEKKRIELRTIRLVIVRCELVLASLSLRYSNWSDSYKNESSIDCAGPNFDAKL